MKRQFENLRATLRFTRFTRKNWGLFSTLGKVVLIGVLSVAVVNHAKADSITVETDYTKDSLLLEEIGLDEVIITGSRIPLSLLELPQMVTIITQESISQQAGVASLNDIFKDIAAVDVRQRGAFSVQTDIAIRGGNFDEIGFAINGVPFSSPQTGHLAADFPLSSIDIAHVEVYKSGSSRSQIPSSLTGIINLVTPKNSNFINANVSAGSFGTMNCNANLGVDTKYFYNFLSAGYTRSDGATPNSAFSSSRIFYQGTARWKNHSVAAQASFSYKPFEANTFYGSGSTTQWESNERLSAAVSGDFTFRNFHLTPQMSWNRTYDHYQWIHHSPVGENYHRTDATDVSLSAWIETVIGKTALGANIRRESVLSTSLGELLSPDDYVKTQGIGHNDSINYTHYDRRFITSVFVEHNILWRKMSLSVALNAAHTQLERFSLDPEVNFSYRLSDAFTLFLSYNQSLRLPTFTDLYYSGANIEGNSALRGEHNLEVNIGASLRKKFLNATAEAYYSHKKNMIDWVKFVANDDDIFHSTNFKVNTLGIEFNASLLTDQLFGEHVPIKSFSVAYAFIHQKSRYPQPITASKYAMDYLRNKLILRSDWVIWRLLQLDIAFRVNQRVGKDNPSYALLDAKIEWKAKHYSLFLSANNLLNRRYFDYVDVPQPRFTFVSGLLLRL